MLKMMNRVEPWKFGQDIASATNVEDAIRLADMAWEVVQTPALIKLADGNILETPMKVNVRSDNNAFLGVVSDRYQTVQNKDAFSFLSYLTDFKFVSAGIVGGGKTIWMCVEVPDFAVLGESMKMYVVFSSTHDGKGAIRAAITPVRPACSNTLNLAFKKAVRSFSLLHKGDVAGKLEMVGDIMEHENAYRSVFQRETERLASIRLSSVAVNSLLENLFPLPENATPRKADIVETQRSGLISAYNADDLGNLRGTAYGFLQAVSDFAYHAEPARQTATYRENKMKDVIKGNALLDKALELLTA